MDITRYMFYACSYWKINAWRSALYVRVYFGNFNSHSLPDHPGTCKIADGIRVKSGAVWYPFPGCMQASCYGTGTDMTIQFTT